MSSRRMERVASLLKQAIGRVIVSELSDPRTGFVTVVKVEPSPDLRTAKVFVSVMGEPAEVRRTLRGLRHAARFIKRRVGDQVEMRSVPELDFVEDKSVKGVARVSRIIADALAGSVPASADASAEKDGAAKITDDELESLLEERKDEQELDAAGDAEESTGGDAKEDGDDDGDGEDEERERP